MYFGPNPPHDLASLKSGLVEAFRLVDRDEIQRAVTQGFRNRVKKCLEQGGGHFEGKRVKEGKPHKVTFNDDARMKPKIIQQESLLFILKNITSPNLFKECGDVCHLMSQEVPPPWLPQPPRTITFVLTKKPIKK